VLEVYEEPRAKDQGAHAIRTECQQPPFWEHLQLHRHQVVGFSKEVFQILLFLYNGKV